MSHVPFHFMLPTLKGGAFSSRASQGLEDILGKTGDAYKRVHCHFFTQLDDCLARVCTPYL